jgi:glycosyltransferase involved in cell wall biosynthesis
LARWLGHDAFASRRVAGLPLDKVREHPWPVMWHLAREKIFQSAPRDWFSANNRFDEWVARRLPADKTRLLVGAESCAEKSFLAARRLGMIRVLDCPQMHPEFLLRVLDAGARRMGLNPVRRVVDSEPMTRRKKAEFELAEWLLVYSDVHRRSFQAAGFPENRIIQIPLWVNQDQWHPEGRRPNSGPLRVIFTGSVGLRKGVFFLLEAMKRCEAKAELTLAGPVGEEGERILKTAAVACRVLGAQSKSALRQLYAAQDLLVLPSLADTFGFVALEAMACGLPVVVTENCGVPVPAPGWRVPIMNSDAIAQRLEYYAKNRGALAQDGETAREFARQFTPERYREQVKTTLGRLLQGTQNQPFNP